MIDYWLFTVSAVCAAFGLGIFAGMSLQWQRNRTHVERLGAEKVAIPEEAIAYVVGMWCLSSASYPLGTREDYTERMFTINKWLEETGYYTRAAHASVVLIYKREPTPDEIAHAKELARELQSRDEASITERMSDEQA